MRAVQTMDEIHKGLRGTYFKMKGSVWSILTKSFA